MAEDSSPKDLNSMKETKLTRRRVMKAAAAAGMSSAAVLNLTPDDVKAADSDQVTIPFDVDGEVKKQVPADRLDWYYRARDATDHIRDGHFQRDSVIRVSTRGGGPKDNAHVIVILDDERGNAEEDRGKIPEERNGVRVEVERHDGTTYEEQNCDGSNYYPDQDNFGGGLRIKDDRDNGEGTVSPRHYQSDLSWFGWTTAAHVLQECYTGKSILHVDTDINGDTQAYEIGTVTKIDPYRDICWIEANSATGTWEYNMRPDDHFDRVEILQTLSEEGMETINSAGVEHETYGVGSCQNDMYLEEWNGSHSIDNPECGYSNRYDQMYSSYEIADQTETGDSGALYFVEDPDNAGNYYAMGSHAGQADVDSSELVTDLRVYGVQGFSIDNLYDRRWDG